MRKAGIFAACALWVLAPPASADVVSDWSELQTSIHTATADPENNFDLSRHQAGSRVGLAMFEAANSLQPAYRSYLRLPAVPGGGSVEAAVAAAAREVLLKIYPGQSAAIDNQYELSLRSVPAGEARERGIAAGRAAAAAAMAAGGVDPKLPLGVYQPTGAPGRWAPSVVPFPPQIVATRPWFVSSAASLRGPAPPPLDSAQWKAAVDEVRRLGAKTSTERSKSDTVAARFWAFYLLDPVLRQLADRPGRTVVQNARMYALLAMAGDDTDIVLADGKTAHMFWRPLNAIRTPGGGGPGSKPDVTWEPLLRTPNQPEYPCGHCVFANVVASVLSAEGPPPPGGYRFTSERMPGVSMSVPTLDDYARAVSLSRIHAGVHFRTTNDASDPIGRQLGELAKRSFAPRLP